jgi:hypothetical protein
MCGPELRIQTRSDVSIFQDVPDPRSYGRHATGYETKPRYEVERGSIKLVLQKSGSSMERTHTIA